jgi:protein SDA1
VVSSFTILSGGNDRQGYRNDAKSVAIVALGCFHPVTKVQSASFHFFLGNDEGSEDSEDESDDDVRSCLHKRSLLTQPLADN